MSEPSNGLIDLLNLPDKKSVEKFCRDLVVSNRELSDVLFAARLGGLAPYRYACHFDQFVPEHLLPTEQDNGALLSGTTDARGNKFARKVSQLFQDRRVFCSHLLYTPAKNVWHLIYFDQRDMSEAANHWKKGGSHIHYSRECYVNDNLDNVWARVCGKPPKPPSSEHVRFTDPRERAFVGPGDSQ